MAIDPRLPLPAEPQNQPLDSDYGRMRRRLVELFTGLLRDRVFVTGSITINSSSSSNTATLPSAAEWVASQGFVDSGFLGGGSASPPAHLSLSADGKTITADRGTAFGTLVCYYIAELR